MSRKVQTIYEYFKEYSEEMIDKVISDLNPEDKKLLVIRYGEDLHNPCLFVLLLNYLSFLFHIFS